MKFLIFVPVFLLFTQSGFSQDFITKWAFPKATSQVHFSALTTDTVYYTWTTSPSGNSGSGNFTVTSPSDVVLSALNIETGDTLILKIAPENLSRFFINNGPDKKRLIDVAKWGDVKWTSMNSAFYGASNLIITATDVPDLSNVADMSYMFNGAIKFNQNIGDWDVSNVYDMSFMFSDADNFNQDIGKWDVSNVYDMSAMFGDAQSFNHDIGDWNVINVRDMSYMFFKAEFFNQDIGDWDLSNVENMLSMFFGAISFNQNLEDWNVSSTPAMEGMFYGATSFNQSIGNWILHSNARMNNMLDSSGIDCNHYSATLEGWQTNNPSVTGVTLGAAGLEYGTSANSARNVLINNQRWTIEGDIASGMACNEIMSANFPVEILQVTIYPNPTSDRITITGDLVDLGSFRMYNSIGQDVTTQVIIEKQSVTTAAINLSGLHSGIFILRCAGASKMIYKE